MNDRATNLLDMSMMPVNDTAITLDDKMLIMDNLESTDIPSGVEHIVDHFPLKIATSCLIIVVSGEVKFSVNFRDFVASDNTCAMINEGTIIEKACFKPEARVILLSFPPGRLAPAGHQHNVHRLYALQVVLLQLQDEHIKMLKKVYGMLRTILTDPAFASNREQTATNCLSLMGSIIEQGISSQPQIESKTSRRDEIVARFLECVNKHYRTHRELSFYAGELCLSLKYMSHVVHEQTGRHPSQWIKDYVILDAKTMLRSGRYTVQQVADELNFPNQSFFGKYFKEAVGVSPKKWK